MHPTPELCEHTYELLRMTLPFRRWNLPHADSLEFRVTHCKDRHGHFNSKDGVGWPDITISSYHTKTLAKLTETMAHEMCHIREWQVLRRHWRGTHGAGFKKLAALVCRRHGFDPDQF